MSTTDRFGNPFAPALSYARGAILASTEDDFSKLQRAWRVIRRHGPEHVLIFTGLEHGLPMTPEDLRFADDEIEKAAQLTIPEIFAAHGESYFRDGERRVIARLTEQDGGRKVIATGGGAFVNQETRRLILDRAIAIWLDSDVETLLERTGRKDNRPLLKDGDPREILTRLREERSPAYSQAPIHVLSENGPHGRTVNKVLQGIGQWL